MPHHDPNRPALVVAHPGMVTLAIMAATIMQVLDITIANVALPHMQGSLSASQDQITWVLTSYIIAAAIMTPATGWIADRLGRKRLFLFSTVGFSLASLLCGQAASLEEMVAWRFFQGLMGAPLVPLSQAVLLDINPQTRHGQAMAVWGAGIMIAPILGPVLGGWLTENWSWRWVFYINLPIGLFAFTALAVFLAEGPLRRRRFDLFGFLALSLALGALQMMLDRGERLDWLASTEIRAELLLAVSALWVFLVHSATHPAPFVTPALLRDRTFALSLTLSFLVGLNLFSTIALLPPMLQNLMDYPVIVAGLVLAPRGFGMMVTMMAAGRLMHRVDPRILIFAGLVLTLLAVRMMAGFSLAMDWKPVAVTGLIQGLGLGFVFSPLSAIAFVTLPVVHRTEAAALYSLLRNLGSALGISVFVTMLTRSTQAAHSALAGFVTPFARAFDGPPLVRALEVPGNPALALLNGEVTRQAAMVAYTDVFMLMSWVGLVALPLVPLLRVRALGPASRGRVEREIADAALGETAGGPA